MEKFKFEIHTKLHLIMPNVKESSKIVRFSLVIFLSSLVLKSGASSVVAVAGCDGGSDKKELQEIFK